MAKNFVQEGRNIDYLNTDAASIASGSVVAIGVLVGVAQTDIPPGKTGAVAIEGVWKLPKDTATELTAGALVYWDTVNKKIVAVTGANIVPAGVAVAAATSAAATANVKINGNISVTITTSGS
jgi:predicted RecA/RadA family phage recombinase